MTVLIINFCAILCYQETTYINMYPRDSDLTSNFHPQRKYTR